MLMIVFSPCKVRGKIETKTVRREHTVEVLNSASSNNDYYWCFHFLPNGLHKQPCKLIPEGHFPQ